MKKLLVIMILQSLYLNGCGIVMAGVAASESTKRISIEEKMIEKYRGITFYQITKDMGYYSDKVDVVKVKSVRLESDAYKAGIRLDDEIFCVNGVAYSYNELLDLFFAENPIVLSIKRNELMFNAKLVPL